MPDGRGFTVMHSGTSRAKPGSESSEEKTEAGSFEMIGDLESGSPLPEAGEHKDGTWRVRLG